MHNFKLNLKKILVVVMFFLFAHAGISQGRTIGITLGANANDVEGKVETQFQYHDSTIGAGIGGQLMADNYSFFNINVDIRDQLFIPPLTLGLGFKGVVGGAEKYGTDFDLGAVAFNVFGEYDFRAVYANLPITVGASVALAPKPLCFRDTEKYSELCGNVSFYIVKNAAIFVAYKKISSEFDDAGKTSVADDALYLGFKIGY